MSFGYIAPLSALPDGALPPCSCSANLLFSVLPVDYPPKPKRDRYPSVMFYIYTHRSLRISLVYTESSILHLETGPVTFQDQVIKALGYLQSQ